jgi:flagellar biosynthesis/type III secretory pathway chaperone
MNGPDVWLDRLDAALAEERRALIEHDVEALVRSTRDKLDALRQLEAEPPAAEFAHRLRTLAEANRANGALLARRRREVNWSLRHLGRGEAAPAYDAQGSNTVVKASVPLAVV